jgi:hypothetical protein
MKHEDVAKLSPEDRQEYENSLKITKIPTILAKTNETSSLINNLIYSSPLPMLIKMSKKPT